MKCWQIHRYMGQGLYLPSICWQVYQGRSTHTLDTGLFQNHWCTDMIWHLQTLIPTVHSESIQTTLLFPHFVTLQPYSYSWKIYPQYPITTKLKQGLNFFCNCIIMPYLHEYSDPSLWDSKLSSGASCFLWNVSKTWLESTCGKFNWLDMICKGTPLSI